MAAARRLAPQHQTIEEEDTRASIYRLVKQAELILLQARAARQGLEKAAQRTGLALAVSFIDTQQRVAAAEALPSPSRSAILARNALEAASGLPASLSACSKGLKNLSAALATETLGEIGQFSLGTSDAFEVRVRETGAAVEELGRILGGLSSVTAVSPDLPSIVQEETFAITSISEALSRLLELKVELLSLCAD